MRTICLLLVFALPLGPGAGFCCCLAQALAGDAPCAPLPVAPEEVPGGG